MKVKAVLVQGSLRDLEGRRHKKKKKIGDKKLIVGDYVIAICEVFLRKKDTTRPVQYRDIERDRSDTGTRALVLERSAQGLAAFEVKNVRLILLVSFGAHDTTATIVELVLRSKQQQGIYATWSRTMQNKTTGIRTLAPVYYIS